MFQVNQQIGGYTLIKQIGRGGFGEVWLAEKRSQFVTKKVAIKLLLDEQINFEAIRQEATLWEQASGHPNILPIIDADIYDGQVLIVSEYAEGGSLAEKLQTEGKFSPEQAVKMTIGILNGLDYLHSQKIIHRDIKPQNVLLQRDTPRLADFGISRAFEGTTSSVTISGTDAYMAPEAFEGKRNVQTDIWSVGVVLYQLLSGKLPFPQANLPERMFAILTRDSEPLETDIPEKLCQIVQKALAKVPENRYQFAKEMREDLEKVLIKIKHPTFAPTEVLEKPIVKDARLTIEDNSIVTEIPTLPDPNKTQPSPIIPLDINKTKFEPVSKPLPTKVQKFIEAKDDAKKKSGNWSRDIGLGIFIIIGILVLSQLIYWRESSKTVTPSNISSNPNLHENLGSNNSSNNSNPNVSNTNKNTNSGNLSNNSNTLPSQPNNEQLANLKAKYDEVDSFENGIAKVKLKGKYGYVDSLGNEIVSPKYDYASSFFDNDTAFVELNKKYGYIDRTGKEITLIKYDEAELIQGDTPGLVKLNNKYGFVNKTGNEVIPLKYDRAYLFRDNLASVKLNNKYGFVDKTGNEIIPLKYDDSIGFQDNVAPVKLNGRWGVIDKTGAVIISFEFEYIANFNDGKATAKYKGRFMEIDKQGNEIKKSKTP